MTKTAISRGVSSQTRAFADAIARRSERHMPGNPFPADSPWGRELDRMHAEDRAAERFRRECELTAYGILPAAIRNAGQGRLVP